MIQADKATIQYVLGSLLKKPQLLSQVDKYSLTVLDFSSKFERLIYTAIDGLYRSNATIINPIDIDNYLSSDTAAHGIFESNHGIEYLSDIVEFGSVENFDYYYAKLKKFNLLRDLQKSGVDISQFYMEDLANPKAGEINEKFEDLTTTDIINNVQTNLLKVESKYGRTSNIETWNVNDEIDDVINDFGSTESVGLSINGSIYSQIINGAELGALTIRSLASGVGKTRLAVADACMLAYPIYFDIKTNQWIRNGGHREKVLFVMTEQTPQQVLRMIIAYLTGIEESKFRFGSLTEDEEKRIQQARIIINKYQDNLHLMRIPDPNISQIKLLIREQVKLHNIKYVFMDYVFISPALLTEFRGNNLRNDEALLLMATALKDLAVELNVSVFTSTQVNAKADDNKEIRNEASLAGGRSTINKADNGIIGMRPTNDEIETLSGLNILKGVTPNLVLDVFKVRSGRWTQVRIWCDFNPGILRLNTLFVTDSRFQTIDDFYTFQPEYQWELIDEDKQFLLELNK